MNIDRPRKRNHAKHKRSQTSHKQPHDYPFNTNNHSFLRVLNRSRSSRDLQNHIIIIHARTFLSFTFAHLPLSRKSTTTTRALANYIPHSLKHAHRKRSKKNEYKISIKNYHSRLAIVLSFASRRTLTFSESNLRKRQQGEKIRKSEKTLPALCFGRRAHLPVIFFLPLFCPCFETKFPPRNKPNNIKQIK